MIDFFLDSDEEGGVKDVLQMSDWSSKLRREKWKKITLGIKIEFSFKHVELEVLLRCLVHC